MNARIVLNLALAMIGFGSLSHAGENAALPVLVEDHVYLLNSSAGHEGLVKPASDSDAQAAKSRSARSSPRSDPSTYGSPSTANTKNYDVSKPTSAKAARSRVIIPPLWIGIMCAGASVGLVIVIAKAWKCYRISRCNWMINEGQGREKYRGWVRSTVPPILASNLIQAQATLDLIRSQRRASVKLHVVSGDHENHEHHEETRELRRAA